MKVSVIIPTYNRNVSLNNVLPTYLCQPHLGEIIIVDDGSSSRVANSLDGPVDERIKVLRNEKNGGLPFSRNRGLEIATCELVFFGEDDLYLPEDFLAILVEEIRAQDLDIIASRLIQIEDEKDLFVEPGPIEEDVIDREKMVGRFNRTVGGTIEVPFVHACALMKRSSVGDRRYDTGYRGNAFREETDFYLRSLGAGCHIGFTDKTCVYHLKSPELKKDGCGDNTTLGYKIQKHRNNIRFLWKNRRAVRDVTTYSFLQHLTFTLLRGASRKKAALQATQ